MARSAERTLILLVDAARPEAEAIEAAARLVRAGRLVAFPTETVYGLGASALDAGGVAAVFRAKGRPPRNPLIVHVEGAAAARRVTANWPESAGRLAERFWPGPLTLVLPRGSAVPDAVTGGGDTVAVRAPSHPVARALLAAAQLPIAAPSANRSQRLSPTRAEHVARDLFGRVALILDAGPCPGGMESTVIDLTTVPPRILRPGPILARDLGEEVGAVEGPPAFAARRGAPLKGPGMLRRHYAPRTRLDCAPTGEAAAHAAEQAARGLRVALLTIGASPAIGDVRRVQMPSDAVRYAARLYDVLHALDEEGLDRIVAELPPDEDAWAAVRDRLARASSAR
ncbi:MAG: threonylcarbamoyl-AMP synthase [Chthonomonadales bacterium]|nr:threonylcarbamoyl-AMP synthase [Chthonomonadales bacterium]